MTALLVKIAVGLALGYAFVTARRPNAALDRYARSRRATRGRTGWVLRRRGVDVSLTRGEHLELHGAVRVPGREHAIVRWRWRPRPDPLPFPAGVDGLWAVVDRVDHEVRTDDATLAAAIAAAWSDGLPPLVLATDGRDVRAAVDGEPTAATLDRVVDLVVALARFDHGLDETLRALDGAIALADDDAIAPGVALAPDGLRLGVRAGALVAELDPAGAAAIPPHVAALATRAGDGVLAIDGAVARFTWRTLERDPARWRAAIAALRALPRRGPYR